MTRECYGCSSNTTRLYKKKYERWYHNRGTELVLCDRCYTLIIKRDAYLKRHSRKQHRYVRKYPDKIRQYNQDYYMKHVSEFREYNSKSITFQGKKLRLDSNPRSGKCSICDTIGLTNMHHTKYDVENPLAHTIELCPRCHLRIHKYGLI